MPRSRLGPWLYGVARRTALKARSCAARRRRAEQEAGRARPLPAPTSSAEADLRWLLDEEIGRLAEKYRSPLVLCVLEGKSRKEAADFGPGRPRRGAPATLVGVGRKSVYVARSSAGGDIQVLPLDWKAITREGDTTTNYPLKPGDRVHVEDPVLPKAAGGMRTDLPYRKSK